MCTALTLETSEGNHLFGRNVDLDSSELKNVLLIPRNYTYLTNVTNEEKRTKYALIGLGLMIGKRPVLVDGLNEKGLVCAVLDLPFHGEWNQEIVKEKINLSPCEVTPWLLSNCASIEEVITELKNLNIVSKPINPQVEVESIHWMVTDKTGKSIVIEKVKGKLRVYHNKVGVLTNEPTFDWHLANLNLYLKVTPNQARSTSWGQQSLKAFSQGFGSIGIPGDFSSPSRFIKAAFLRNHAVVGSTHEAALSEMFHILNAVAMIKGAVVTEQGKDYFTQCSTCMCQETGMYYYNTYNNNQINVIHLFEEDLDSQDVKIFPLQDRLAIYLQK